MDLIEFGVILKPQGIRGEVKVKFNPLEGFDPSGLKTVYVMEKGNYKEYPVQSMRLDHSYAFVKLEGIDDRNDAEQKRNALLSIKREDAPLPEGTHYVNDLVGMAVQDETGRRLGVLTEIIETGSADVYVVKDADKSFMFPALKRVIIQTDLAARTMTLDAKTLAEVAVYAV